MKEFVKDLVEEFGDADFAHSYMQSHAISRIAAQIYSLRKQRDWSQSELSKRSGIAQERISKIESADFESITLKTLQKFARAFDIDLRITFSSFSSGIIDVVKLDPKQLEVLEREADLKYFNQHAEKIVITREPRTATRAQSINTVSTETVSIDDISVSYGTGLRVISKQTHCL